MPPILDIILWFAVFLFSLSFHESSHALVSHWYGDDTGKRQGRITLNPLPHIDPFGTVLFPLVGLISGGFMFGWAKPTPTTPDYWRDPKKASIAVAAAGPASNLILFILAFTMIKALVMLGIFQRPFGHSGLADIIVPAVGQASVWGPVAKVLGIAFLLNLMLAIFNIIPIPPLDGSNVLEALLPYEASRAFAQLRPFGIILLLAFILLGLFEKIFNPVENLTRALLFGS